MLHNPAPTLNSVGRQKMREAVAEWTDVSNKYVAVRQERPKAGASIEELDSCIAIYDDCLEDMHDWFVEKSQRFMGVGAEVVYETLRGYEGVPGAVIVDKWTNDDLTRSLAVRPPSPVIHPGS